MNTGTILEELQELIMKRQPLVDRRNRILDSLFLYLFCKEELKAIDKELDEIEETYRMRMEDLTEIF